MMVSLTAGMDEVATGGQSSEGWTYCVMPSTVASALQTDLRIALPGLTFHGNQFTPADEATYRKFLEIVRTAVEAGAPSLLQFVLMSASSRDEYVAFCRRSVTAGLAKSGVSAKKMAKRVEKIAPGIGELLKRVDGWGSTNTIDLFIDDDDVTSKLKNAVAKDATGKPLTGPMLLRAVYRAFQDSLRPTAPSLGPKEIDIVKDEASALVQVADVVGNFALAYYYSKLKTLGATRTLKANIFADTFGDTLDQATAREWGKPVGDDDIELDVGAVVLGIKS